MVLGVFADAAYAQAELPLIDGDRLLFYTDGITEARDRDGEEFGEIRLANAASPVRTLCAEALKTHLMDTLRTFTAGTFDDDATLIVVEIP
jgi:serine phosphatase RsbU (regulator of sigma subunit)